MYGAAKNLGSSLRAACRGVSGKRRHGPELINSLSEGTRIPGLDGVRGLAIVLVVLSHAGLGTLASGGRVGVTLFFVLSGFLITRLLIIEKANQGSVRVSAFYGRRALRLLPALFVYLIGIALISWSRRLDVPIWDMTWPPALYVANYAQIFGHDLYAHRHTWSLAVEEHFYLIWPILVRLGATKRVKPLAIGVVLLLVWRAVVGAVDPYWALRGSDTNAYALGMGCLLALILQRGTVPRLPRWSPGIAVGSLVVLSLLPTETPGTVYLMAVWLPPVAAIVSVIAIAGTVQHDPVQMRSVILRWFGLISYALYLWHAPLMRVPGLGESPLRRLAGVGLAIAIAWSSWVVVERPILNSRWRSKLRTSVDRTLTRVASDETTRS